MAVADSCIFCAVNNGHYNEFSAIVDLHPEKIFPLIFACTNVDSCVRCVQQLRSNVDVLFQISWIIFDSQIKIAGHVKIFDKILDMAIEQLGICNLAYQDRFKESDGFLPKSDRELIFNDALIGACFTNNIKFAEKIFMVVRAADLNINQRFTRRYRHRFLDCQFGGGFVFYLKNCRDLTDEDVLIMADFIKHRMFIRDPKHDFYIFFDLIEKYKLSKQAAAEYVAKNHQFFQ
jgi:hypothetical protein